MKNTIATLSLIIFSLTSLTAQNRPLKANEFTLELSLEDGISIIQWEINQEVNTSSFILERSFDGQNFEIINIQKAKSSSYSFATYAFEDVENETGIGSYRLRLVLMGGEEIVKVYQEPTSRDLAQHSTK